MLSAVMSVGVCVWPISTRAVRRLVEFLALCNRAQTLDFVVEDMTLLRMEEMVWTVPLLGGGGEGVDG